jgi:hypothetical protein
VQFSTAPIGTAKFRHEQTGPACHVLYHILYAPHSFKREHGRWARNLHELGLEKLTHSSLCAPPKVEIQGQSFTVTATVQLEGGKTVTLHL